MAQTIQDIFAPLIGEFAWSVQNGHGTFLTMEFGAPHRMVREPKAGKPTSSVRFQRLRARRQILLAGDWHLWIVHSDWKISTANYSASSSDINNPAISDCFQELDGQALISVEQESVQHSTIFKFDLGGILHTEPSPYVEPDYEQWSLSRLHGGGVAFLTNGQLDFYENDPETRSAFEII